MDRAPNLSSTPFIPEHLKKCLAAPLSPWIRSEDLFEELKNQEFDRTGSYRWTEVKPHHPEANYVRTYFMHSKPDGYHIGGIFCVLNRKLQDIFLSVLDNMDEEANKYKPRELPEEFPQERLAALKQWEALAKGFYPLVIKRDNKEESLLCAKVLPLWQGTSQVNCPSILERGFGFGKLSSKGCFGNGVYLTTSAAYAAKHAPGESKYLILALGSMRTPYPVVSDVPPPQECSDIKNLKDRGAYKNYNAHYVPLVPRDKNDPNCVDYYPSYKNEPASFAEIVLFSTGQALPCFYLILVSDMTKALSSSNDIYQIPAPGLNLEGICKKKSCEFNGKKVVIRKGIASFKVKHLTRGYCPSCDSRVKKVSRLILMNCFYSFTGVDHNKTHVEEIAVRVDAILPLEISGWKFTSFVVEAKPSVLNVDPPKRPKLLHRTVKVLSNHEIPSFHQAASNGQIDVMEELWKKNPTLAVSVNSDGWTPLHVAAFAGQVNVMQWLLKIAPELIHSITKDGWTPLHTASQAGKIEAMDYLVKQDPNLYSKLGHDGWTPFYERVSSPGESVPEFKKKCNGRWAPIHAAAYGGHIKAMEWLLNNDQMLVWLLSLDATIGRILCEDGSTLLHVAARGGHIEVMEYLLEKDPKLIQQFSERGDTPLHAASAGGHIKVIQWLLERDRTLVTKSNKKGRTPLHAAAERGQVETMRLLLKEAPQLINTCDVEGWSPFHAGIQGGQIKAVRILLEIDPSLIEKFTIEGWTALHLAALEGRVSIIEWLLKKAPKLINKISKEGQTPLHFAAQTNQIAAMTCLLGQDPTLINKSDHKGRTPFSFARGEGADWLEGWIEGAVKKGTITFFDELQAGRLDIMEVLWKKNPKIIYALDTQGWTSLHVAAYVGQVPSIGWLVEKDPHLVLEFSKDGSTPLMLAKYFGQEQAAACLASEMNESKLESVIFYRKVQAEEFGNARSIVDLYSTFFKDGWTPLHIAAQHGQIETMKWLLKEDPNLIKKFSKEGWTVVHVAAKGGQAETVKWLLKKDSKLLRTFSNDGWTPLHAAAFTGQIPVMRYLLKKNPKLISMVNLSGQTPHDIAKHYKHTKAANWLEKMMWKSQ